MRHWIKRLFSFGATAAVVGAIVYAILPQPLPVDVEHVVRGNLQVSVDEDGKTRIRQRYVVSAPLAGRLLRVQLRPGDPVQSGETVLATLEPVQAELLDARSQTESEIRVEAAEARLKKAAPDVDRARAALEYSEADFAKAQQLRERAAISQLDLEEKRSKQRMHREELKAMEFAQIVAEHEVKLAKAALLRTRPPGKDQNDNSQFEIRSPVSGRILRVMQESSTVVAAGTEILELGDPGDLEAEVDVLSSDAVRISVGDKVLLEQWGGDEPLLAQVRLVEPSGFTKVSALGVEEQRVNVIATIVDPPEKWKNLGDAYWVEARIIIWEREDVLKVPTSALFRQGDQWAVFRLAEQRAEFRPLRIGRRNGLEAEVLEGLNAGDVVIVHPGDKLKPGVPVVRR